MGMGGRRGVVGGLRSGRVVVVVVVVIVVVIVVVVVLPVVAAVVVVVVVVVLIVVVSMKVMTVSGAWTCPGSRLAWIGSVV